MMQSYGGLKVKMENSVRHPEKSDFLSVVPTSYQELQRKLTMQLRTNEELQRMQQSANLEWQRKLTEQQRANEELQRKQQRLNQDWDRKLTEQQRANEELDSILAGQQIAVQELEDNLAGQMSENEELESILAGRQNQIKELEPRLTEKQNEIEKLKSRLTEQQNEIQELKARITSQQSQIKDFESKVSVEFIETKEMQSRLTSQEELESKLDFLRIQNQNEYGRVKPDVAICVRNRTDEILHAHKLILASKSDVFGKIFAENVVKTEEGFIRIEDATLPVMQAVISFCYDAEINFTDEVPLEEVLEVAYKYRIALLQKICEEQLIRKIVEVNLPQMLKLARKYESDRLKAGALEYFKSNFDAVLDELYPN